MKTMQHARFWVYVNGGPVKLTLEPGWSLRWSQWRPTDEGWEAQSETYEFDGAEVVRQWQTDGRDCDGRLTHTGTQYCPLARLAAGPTDDGVTYADWEVGAVRVFDETAAAAGY